MKFKTVIYPIGRIEQLGRTVTVEATDALDANAKFCKLLVRLEKAHGGRFDFEGIEEA